VRDSVVLELESVGKRNRAARKLTGYLAAHLGNVAFRVDGLRLDCVIELRLGASPPCADSIEPRIGSALVNDDGIGRKSARELLLSLSPLRGELVSDRCWQIHGADPSDQGSLPPI
jgi:hypothetical protein